MGNEACHRLCIQFKPGTACIETLQKLVELECVSMARVYIGNLAKEANKDDVLEACSKYGPITDVWIATDPAGFAFVTFEEDSHAEEAVQGLCNAFIQGQLVKAELSKKRPRKLDSDCEIVVAVASKSKPKLEAAQVGFARLLPRKY